MKKTQPQTPKPPERIRIRVLYSVAITGYGFLEPGEHELPHDLALLLAERGFAEEMSEKEVNQNAS